MFLLSCTFSTFGPWKEIILQLLLLPPLLLIAPTKTSTTITTTTTATTATTFINHCYGYTVSGIKIAIATAT